MAPKETISRRDFFQQTGLMLVSLSFFGLGSSSCKSDNITIGEVEIRSGRIYLDLAKPSFRSLRQPGRGISISLDVRQKPLLVNRIDKNEVAALSAQCTHAGYTVLPPENGVLVCSSGHGGRYSLDGQVLQGPPKHSLRSYPCQLQDDMIIIDYARG
jgi:Rieske Fe-S protein